MLVKDIDKKNLNDFTISFYYNFFGLIYLVKNVHDAIKASSSNSFEKGLFLTDSLESVKTLNV